MNMKFKRYLDAKREGKSVKDCVRAALPGVAEDHPRFTQWEQFAETQYIEIKNTIELEGLNKPKKKAPAKKPVKEAEVTEEVEAND